MLAIFFLLLISEIKKIKIKMQQSKREENRKE